jgi:hypothetical protein
MTHPADALAAADVRLASLAALRLRRDAGRGGLVVSAEP